MTKKAQVIQYKSENPNVNARDIADELGIKYNTVKAAVSHMRAEREFNPQPEDLELTVNIPGEQLAAATPWWKEW